MRYWDSSALVPLIVQEAETEQRQLLQRQDDRVVTWWGSSVECASALNRLHRDGNLDRLGLSQALDKLRRSAANWLQVRPSERVKQRALRLLRVHPLRAADSLQLAAALVACDDDPATLTLVCRATSGCRRRRKKKAFWSCRPGATMNRPNIILIITDQQRYDTVAAVGFPHVGTRAHRPGSATTGGLHSGLSVPCRH